MLKEKGEKDALIMWWILYIFLELDTLKSSLYPHIFKIIQVDDSF